MSSRSPDATEPADPPGPSLDDVLATHELVRGRAPDFEAENRALIELMRALAEAPETILQKLVEAALDLCGGESAGISILEGGSFFRWSAVAGAWAHLANRGMPRAASPSGNVIDRDAALLFLHPGRYFPEMARFDPLATSALLVPFHVRGEPVGTVWVVTHGSGRRFDQEDLRLLTSLSGFAACAYQGFTNLGLEQKIKERTKELASRNESLLVLADERDHLIHDLEVHQTELEAQNRQLRDAQSLLEDSRARYSDLYDFAPVAYCTLSLAGCIDEINLTGAALLGMPRGQLIGKPLAVFVAPGHRAAFRGFLEQRRSDETNMVIELDLATSATPTVIQLASTLVLDRSAAIAGYRATLSDITDLKRAETALRLAVRMREDFLAVVSHDLRNPLNSIVLASQILLDSGDCQVHATENLHRIDRAATRMTRMLSDLLDLSSMDAGHLSMERTLEQVDELLSSNIESLRSNATEKSVRLELAIETPGLIAYCDRDRISQVLANLIGNAIKFSRRGTFVRVEARQHGDLVEISVRDAGVGIESSQLAHIFDPYWQVASTAKKGTGLGLSIAKGIVEVHGGKLWAESRVGHGSSFRFTLPAAPSEDLNAEAGRARRSSSGPLPRISDVSKPTSPDLGSILVVDDEVDTRALLSSLLRIHGYETATASDGAEALSHLRGARKLPWLILLDLVMPNTDGWQFLEARNQDPRLAAIPVVLISGQVAARSTTRMLGIAGYVEKPIVATELLEMLADVASRTDLVRTEP